MLLLCCSMRLQGRVFRFNAKSISIFPSSLWCVFLICIAVFGYSRYFIFGPGLETLLNTNLVYFSAEDAVAARSLANENFYGQGVYMAAVVAYIILPVLFATSAINGKAGFDGGKSKKLYYGLFVIFFVLSFAYAFQTRQKAPIVTVILTYLLLHVSRNADVSSESGRKKNYLPKLVVGGAGIFLISASLYVLVFGMNFVDSVYATFTRVFLVPSATEANYFYVFPDLIPYRGFFESFVIRVFYPPGVSGVSIYDVAMAATGNEFSANASFLAIGWSGFGYLGVVIVAASLCFGLLLLDGMTYRCSRKIKRLVFALSIPPLLVLNSASFLDYLGAGGILGGLLFLFTFRENKTPARLR